ncbi:KGG domain-containing protein [Nannocystis pusilla]|uniref:KGG domain-containing protein n=1 Tax=Nannocystis pusilla TaxID=889268 RepID=UPI003B7CF365
MSDEKQSGRGFLAMEPEKQREIARRGGQAAHASGTAHEFTSEEARDAGRKGGASVSKNREHMARIGAMGGRKTAARKRGAAPPTLGVSAARARWES